MISIETKKRFFLFNHYPQVLNIYVEYNCNQFVSGVETCSSFLVSISQKELRWLRSDLISAFTIFTGLLDIDPNCFFLPPARGSLRGHPYKVTQGASHRRRRGSSFSVRVVKYWNKFPVPSVTAPSVNVFKKRLEKVWTEVFPHLPHWLNTHLPIPLLSPILHAHHPLTVIISICYPTPCSMYVVSLGPVWPTFYYYTS